MYIRNVRTFDHVYTSSYLYSSPPATVVLSSGKQEYSPCLGTTHKREQVGSTRTEVRMPLHVVLKFIQGSRPAAHLDIAGAWSRSTSDFVVMAKGGTDALVSFFGSTWSFVASGISFI